MRLSKHLISEFAKMTNNKKDTNNEKTVYGTIVIKDSKPFVRIDGSQSLFLANSTSSLNNDDRVMVIIKNHTATIIGNITNPSINDSDLSSVYDKLKQIDLIKTDVDNLKKEITTILKIESSAGTMVNNNETCILSVIIYHGSEIIKTIEKLESIFGSGAYLKWKEWNMNENLWTDITTTDSRIKNGGFELHINSNNIDIASTFKCELRV